MIQTYLTHRERYNEVIERGDDPAVETLVALDEDFIGPPTAALAADSNVPILKPAKRRKTIKTVALTVHTCRWPLGDPAHPDFHYCGKRPLIFRLKCQSPISPIDHSLTVSDSHPNAVIVAGRQLELRQFRTLAPDADSVRAIIVKMQTMPRAVIERYNRITGVTN